MSWIDDARRREKARAEEIVTTKTSHVSTWDAETGGFACSCGYSCKTEKSMQKHIKEA